MSPQQLPAFYSRQQQRFYSHQDALSWLYRIDPGFRLLVERELSKVLGLEAVPLPGASTGESSAAPRDPQPAAPTAH